MTSTLRIIVTGLMSRFCGLFPLLSLLVLASGVALGDSGDPDVAGYPFKKS